MTSTRLLPSVIPRASYPFSSDIELHQVPQRLKTFSILHLGKKTAMSCQRVDTLEHVEACGIFLLYLGGMAGQQLALLVEHG